MPGWVSQNHQFQSTRPLRGATVTSVTVNTAKGVSIHAPPARRDLTSKRGITVAYSFNPRAPCEARRNRQAIRGNSSSFNPRAPCEARHKCKLRKDQYNCFNPRAPCEARLIPIAANGLFVGVSIHAPPARRDIIDMNVTNY